MSRPVITFCVVAFLTFGGGVCSTRGAEPETLPPPGPENAGLRLRLVVVSERPSNEDVHHVRLDLINVTDEALTVVANWPHENEGDFREYCESAVSIHTYPEIIEWGLQVHRDTRESPQSIRIIPARDMLTVQWTSRGRQLKNKVSRPNDNPNLSFPADGLYGVHAGLVLRLDNGATGTDMSYVDLRSNEQLVSIGGSIQAPKQAVVQLYNVAADHSMSEVSGGAIDGLAIGDQFEMRTGMSCFWRLTITETRDHSATGDLVIVPGPMERVLEDHEYPRQGTSARLLPDDPE